MAETIKLVRTADFASDISSLDLTANAAGFALAENGWVSGDVPEGETAIDESMTLVVRGTSQDNLATVLGTLNQKIRECRWAKDPAERYQVWLRDQLTNETNARQAVLFDLRKGIGVSLHDNVVDADSKWLVDQTEMGFTRGHWEQTTVEMYAVPDATGIGHADYPIDVNSIPNYIAGDIPARMAGLSFWPQAGSGAVTELWWGFKTSRHCTLANFTTPWDTGSATLGTDTDLGSDTVPPYENDMVSWFLVTFATNSTMVSRAYFTAYNISNANYEDLRGTYRILARMKVDTGFSCRVRLAYGLDSSSRVYNDPVTVTGTSLYMYDLGTLTLPCGGPGSSMYSAMQNSTMWIEAERTAGTLEALHGLYIDTWLIPIPIDEGCGHIKSGTGVQSIVLCDALGRIESYDYTGANITGVLDTSGTGAKDCTMPIGSSYMVTAAQRAASSVRDDAVVIIFKVFPRYLTLRGTA